MGHRDTLRSGIELDAVTHRYKRHRLWRPGVRKVIKRAINKRARKLTSEDAILVESGLLEKLLNRALQQQPSDDWEVELAAWDAMSDEAMAGLK